VNTAPARPSGKRLARLPGLVRTLHLHLSMTASLCIAFFALSGLVANLRDGKDRDATAVVPRSALASPAALARHLQDELHLPAAPAVEEVGPDLLTATADLGEERLDIAVYRSTAAMEVSHWRPLPPALQLDREALSAWCAQRFHGVSEHSDDSDDPQHERVALRIESVWTTHAITIDRPTRRWGVSTSEHGLAKVLTDLHTGRQASWWQRLLMDAIAITLLLSVVTGTVLGLAWVARPRRRLLAIAALTGGLLCLSALIVGR
jgi:hypothetical protein